jgi:hypothetical protein
MPLSPDEDITYTAFLNSYLSGYVRFRRLGKVVYAEGRILNSSASEFTGTAIGFGTIKASLSPSTFVQCALNRLSSVSTGVIRIHDKGIEIYYATPTSGDNYNSFNVSYLVD